MAGDSYRFVRSIALAFFPLAFGIVLPLSGTAFALGGGGEANVLARAAGEGTAESVAPDPPRLDNVPQERLERWRAMPPEERERIRERYHRWKELPPEQRERIKERHRRWRALPEAQRRYLKDRRELMKDAGPEERRVVRSFFARMRSLPAEERHAVRKMIREVRSLPPGKREESMRSWPYYRGLSERERGALRWFLFAPPGEPHEHGGRPSGE
ncbi:MAG: hypothetical protein CO109_00575 [Deltaproteobacteria bacterium CG_4_9_14_3_um_filter_65_9]|nr:MAG: hypothetical protein CO109_00575 [Deltaproteobacteria bacterium CG_4_9_14_3_um_filter_65_9]